MTTNHTLGPWRAGKPNKDGKIAILSSGADWLVLGWTQGTDAEANARLVAAAPALLEALSGLVDAHDAGIPLVTDHRWSQARATINNAKGKE